MAPPYCTCLLDAGCALFSYFFQISGPSNTTEPNAGLATEARASPLARLVVKQFSNIEDPEYELLYNPVRWRFANRTAFPEGYDWMAEPVKRAINGHEDAFSQEYAYFASLSRIFSNVTADWARNVSRSA